MNVLFGFAQQLLHLIAGIRFVLSFFDLAFVFVQIVLEVDVELQTIVEVELNRRYAEILL